MIEAKTPEEKLVIEFKTEKGHDHKMFKDDREKERGKALMNDKLWESEDSDEDFNCPPPNMKC